MNIGIMIHSETGHTKNAALILQEKLTAAGHSVQTEIIITKGPARPGRNFTLEIAPKVASYDAIVFATPVMAFAASPAMNAYISQISTLKNKKVAFLITKQLPFYWTGANQAVKWMKKNCELKGAEVCGWGIIIRTGKKQKEKTEEVADYITSLF